MFWLVLFDMTCKQKQGEQSVSKERQIESEESKCASLVKDVTDSIVCPTGQETSKLRGKQLPLKLKMRDEVRGKGIQSKVK